MADTPTDAFGSPSAPSPESNQVPNPGAAPGSVHGPVLAPPDGPPAYHNGQPAGRSPGAPPEHLDKPQRRRISTACVRCRKRKIRCSGDLGNGHPCRNCMEAKIEQCIFLPVAYDNTEEALHNGTISYSNLLPGRTLTKIDPRLEPSPPRKRTDREGPRFQPYPPPDPLRPYPDQGNKAIAPAPPRPAAGASPQPQPHPPQHQPVHQPLDVGSPAEVMTSSRPHLSSPILGQFTNSAQGPPSSTQNVYVPLMVVDWRGEICRQFGIGPESSDSAILNAMKIIAESRRK